MKITPTFTGKFTIIDGLSQKPKEMLLSIEKKLSGKVKKTNIDLSASTFIDKKGDSFVMFHSYGKVGNLAYSDFTIVQENAKKFYFIKAAHDALNSFTQKYLKK